jgi:serine/threonine-protein kinase
MTVGEQAASATPGPDSARARAHAAREALVGRTIAGRYVLRSIVGHGGMGAVYEAEHLGLGKRVAIKFIDPEWATNERVVARFAREARATSSVESAHIVSVFDAGTEDNRPYLVMELLRGEDLGRRLRRTTSIALDEAMHVVAQVLKGLAKAHAAGIVHRDLKPDNVFLVKGDTDPLFAKIVDFGVSKLERPRDRTSPLALTGRGTVLGTPFYMCPEQAQAASDVDPRADIYSVGAILFECLSGRPPHTGETYEQVILSICMRDAPNLRAIAPSVPPEIAAFVARALSRDRAQRFASAERMLAALHEVAPQEKARVPLDPGPAQTLLSAGASMGATQIDGVPAALAGAAAPASPVLRAPAAETRLVGSLSPADLPPVAAPAAPAPARPAPAIAARPAEPPPLSTRSRVTVVATGIAALLLGVLVMLGLLRVASKKPAEPITEPVASRAAPPRTAGEAALPLVSAPASASVAPAPPTDEPAASASATASAAASAPAASAVAPKSGAPRPRPGTGSGAAKPGSTRLDISRDLP